MVRKGQSVCRIMVLFLGERGDGSVVSFLTQGKGGGVKGQWGHGGGCSGEGVQQCVFHAGFTVLHF